MKKLITAALIALPLTFCNVYAYSDVPKGHWAENYIKTASDKGIMRGTGNNEFGLGKPVKRAEFAIMLCNLMNWDISQYTNSPEKYDLYIYSIKAHNVFNEDNFRPNDYITRKEMADMLIRAIGFSGIETESSPFTDINDPYITAAYDFGIINGKGKNIFAPNDTISREESAVMMCRLYDKYSQKLNHIHGFYAISSWNQREFAGKMESVSFGWSRLEYNNGVVLNTTSKNGNDWKIPDGAEEAIEYFSQKGVPANLAVIMNTEQKGENNKNACETILLNPENRKKAVEQIIEKSSEFKGITIDFEGMKGEELKNGFNLFLTELKNAMSNEKTLYTAVHPVTNGEYFNGYDYGTIGKISDMVIIMAHDYGALSMNEAERNAGFTTTPVTPFNQVYFSLKEATKQIDDKNKITLALSLASTTCWTLDNNGKVINEYSEHPSQETIEKRLSQPNTITEYSQKYRNPKATYIDDKGNKVVLWYENTESIHDKILLARMFGINKISLWRIGQITDDIWNTIESLK